MKRVVVRELLDDDRGSPQQIADSLADLRMFNRYFGGNRSMAELLHRVARQAKLRRMTYLDVAGASGDAAAHARHALARNNIMLEPVVLDRSASHLARDGTPGISGSAFELPFRDASFDVVGCSLFIHHLEAAEIKSFLQEAFRCCRYAVILNDLKRSRLHWLAAVAGRPIYRSPITRHDAPASVRRAYTPDELRTVLQDAGFPAADFSHHYFFRMGVVLWRRSGD